MFGNITTRLYLWLTEKRGFVHGKNFNIEKGANIDRAFCSLISCGDNVTLTKDVYILAHDAAMFKFVGKTKVAPVKIGNNVFVGAKTVILPGTSIGDNVIIAANSCVTKTIPSGEVWGGVPAHFIMKTEDFIVKHERAISCSSEETKYVE